MGKEEIEIKEEERGNDLCNGKQKMVTKLEHKK